MASIAPDSTVLRCLNWDRDRFDNEFELQNGTTYNSFLIRGDQMPPLNFPEVTADILFLLILVELFCWDECRTNSS